MVLAGVGALSFGMPLGIAVIVLMVIVVASYRQTIAAYPRGGGTYIVAKDNLGTLPGLAAASSILIGYTADRCCERGSRGGCTLLNLSRFAVNKGRNMRGHDNLYHNC